MVTPGMYRRLSVDLAVNGVRADFAEVGPIQAGLENCLLQIRAGLLFVVINVQYAHLRGSAGAALRTSAQSRIKHEYFHKATAG